MPISAYHAVALANNRGNSLPPSLKDRSALLTLRGRGCVLTFRRADRQKQFSQHTG